MKHRHVGANKAGVVNADGHAVGLDIGATGVRAAVLAPGTMDGRPSVTVHGIGQIELPPGTVVNGVVTDEGVLTTAIKNLWHANKLECHNVIVGISNQQVIVRDLTIPDLKPDQQAKALPYQAREVVALPMDQVVLDFCPLGLPDPETNMVHGLLLASPREPVLAAVRAVEKAGLRVARVDLSSFAALRSIADERLTVEAVIDIGAHLTTIVIHDRGVPKLVRTLARGGEMLTEQLSDRMSVTIPEAEMIKRQVGLDGGQPEVSRMLSDALRPLFAEIRTSLGYYRSTSHGGAIERIALTGGTSALRGIIPALSGQVGLPTVLIDPMQHIRNRHATKSIRPEYEHTPSAVSVGLAMGAAA